MAYNAHDADALIDILDGVVRDASLEPGNVGEYPSVAAWVAAAASQGDQLTAAGIGVSEPVKLFTSRSNGTLESKGIDSVSLTIKLWVNQDCDTRVATTDTVSRPDPCRFSAVFDVETPSGCAGPFAPRSDHVSVWTGDEMIVYGGSIGTIEGSDNSSGLAFNPDSGSWRDIAPSPWEVLSWPRMHGFWTGEVFHVLGRTIVDDESEIIVQTYDPQLDSRIWSAPLPVEKGRLGGAAWTGSEIVMAG